jgi:methionyl-tRNA synthetase
VNARPHIGFALEVVQADVLARFGRQHGDRVRFQAGTDDNSLKNVLAAQAAGEDVRLDAVLGALFEACSALGREVAPFLPDAAVRIIRQCTPRDGTLPPAVPVFRRLSPANSAREAVSSGGGPAPGR